MKILVPVSLDPSRVDAGRLAAETARSIRAEVRFLYVVDRGGIRRVAAGVAPGGAVDAASSEEEIVERTAAEGRKEVMELCRVCKESGVPFAGEIKTGQPREEIGNSSAGCDLVIAGLGSRYSYALLDEPGKLVLSLMNDTAIPLLLAASPYRPVKTVVIGCGGGARTSAAVGAMSRFGLWKEGCRIVLLAVDDSEEAARSRIALPRQILADAGYSGWEEKVVSGTKAEAFLVSCEEEQADAVVLGGWSTQRWHEFFGLSITGRLLDAAGVHVFLHL